MEFLVIPLKIYRIEAGIRAQDLNTYLVWQAGGVFTSLADPASVYTEFIGTG